MNEIIGKFGLNPDNFAITPIGTGHIHKTYRLDGYSNYILQRVNKSVFRQPELIASNLRLVADYLTVKFPDYPFLRPIAAQDGRDMVYDGEGYPWRLFPYRENTFTINQVENVGQAFKASAEFGRLTLSLDGLAPQLLRETIPHFHDLSLRYQQLELAIDKAIPDRLEKGKDLIRSCTDHFHLVDQYQSLINSGSLRRRITHNDTKINNILFNSSTGEADCVIDLDTLMPGYFIYDLGDMVRTFVSPVSEEEQDFSKIEFRREIYEAITNGYLSTMEEILRPEEISAIPYAGKMMTFIMALRFLTDYLSNDIYYHTSYPGQNLVRAGNQLKLLEVIGKNA